MSDKTSILFLCTGNSCRSQMAEAFARHDKPDVIQPFSAGIEKHGLDKRALAVLEQEGVDTRGLYSKTIGELPHNQFDYVVTLCGHAHESCPYFPGKIVHKGFDDPPFLAKTAPTENEAVAHYLRVAREIRAFVQTLPKSLENI